MANAGTSTNAPSNVVANQFSLLPSIFTPFNGVPEVNKSSFSRDAKLRAILEKLDEHQSEVRRNMMFLVAQQKDRLIEEAKEALRQERQSTGLQSWSYDKDVAAPDDQEIHDLLQRMKAPAKPNADPKEYESKPDDPILNTTRNLSGQTDTEGDSDMPSRTALIRAALDENLRNLVHRATREMKNYDMHAEQTQDHYKQALLRRPNNERTLASPTEVVSPVTGPGSMGGPVSGSMPAATRKGGILLNKNAEIFVDTAALARMDASTDAMVAPPMNQIRRGSGDTMKDLRRW